MDTSFSVVFEIDEKGIFKHVIQGDPGFEFLADRKEFIGKHYANFMNKEIEKKINLAKAKLDQGHLFSDFNYSLKTKKGLSFYSARVIKNVDLGSEIKYFLFVKDNTLLEKQKSLLNSILDSSISGIIEFKSIRNSDNEIIDFEYGLINSTAEKLLGYSQEEIFGNTLLTLFPGHITTGLFQKYMDVVETGETLIVEYSYQYDNVEGWYKTSVVKLDDGFVVTFDDITTRKVNELKLLESNNLINEISKKNGFVFYQYLLTKEGNSSLPFISDGLEYMTGITAGDVKDTVEPFYKIIIEEDTNPYWQSILTSAEQLSPWDHEFRILKPFDEIRWIKGKSTPVRLENGDTLWHGFLEDITERKIAENELLTSKNRLKLALESGEYGIWDIDLISKDLFWDDTVFRLGEVEKASFQGNFYDYINLVHPDWREEAHRIYQEALNGRREYKFEYKVITGKGNIRWQSSSASIIMNSKNEPIRMIGITQDITSRKENEEKLIRQNEKLREISWIESHIIRSPLSNILGLIPLFDKKNMGTEENLDLLKKLEIATHKLDEVIREVVQKASEIYEINKKDK